MTDKCTVSAATTILFFVSSLSCCLGAITYDDLLDAIHQVEASGRKVNVPDGDGGLAIGPYQIHRAYHQDAEEVMQTNLPYENCRNYEYARKVVRAYFYRYGRKFIKEENWEALARIHNGGPRGHKKDSTVKYWLKVKAALETAKEKR